LKNALVGRGRQVAGVHRQVDIGLGVLALGCDPLPELGVVPVEELDRDACLVGEALEGNLDVVVAPAVDPQHLAVGSRARGDGGQRHNEADQKPWSFHAEGSIFLVDVGGRHSAHPFIGRS
jgi:hypothetical protein